MGKLKAAFPEVAFIAKTFLDDANTPDMMWNFEIRHSADTMGKRNVVPTGSDASHDLDPSHAPDTTWLRFSASVKV